MSEPLAPIERRIRIAALLVLAGLGVEMTSLTRVHPLAFVVFLIVGCGAIATGAAVFLISLLDMSAGRNRSWR